MSNPTNPAQQPDDPVYKPDDNPAPHHPRDLRADDDVHFFVPGDLMFLVEHIAPLERDELLTHLAQNPIIREFSERIPPEAIRAGRVHSLELPRINQDQGEYDDPTQQTNVANVMLEAVRQMPRPGKPGQPPRRTSRDWGFFSSVFINLGDVRGDDLLDLVNRLDYELDRQRNPDPDMLYVRTAMPNWFAGGAPLHVGTGGPGAYPQPANIPLDSQWVNEAVDTPGRPFRFRVPHLDGVQRLGRGAGVEVAILDTAPPQEMLKAAVKALKGRHPLVRSLLAPNGDLSEDRLRITYGPEDLFNQLNHEKKGFDIKGHEYLMPDHGLFVAGIIHTIAPEADLHLVQVLNDWGVGTMETITLGLKRVLADWDQRKPLIINMSFALAVVRNGHPRPALSSARVLEDPAFIERAGWSVEWYCELFQAHGALLVAAAGNDAQPGQDRPDARQPAAFDSVIGVAALRANGQLAPYSNVADTPPHIGVATFGGDVEPGSVAAGRVAHSDDDYGVLGIYLGPYPDNGAGDTPVDLPENMHNGWARWSGTSFAAPVLTGVLARLRSTVYSARDALRRVYGAQPDKTPLPAVEDVLTAQQGN